MTWKAAVYRLAVTFSALGLSGMARAEPFHYQPVPLGERSLGMGGAFTGLANEPSASYYNPAGLVRLEDTALSAGLTLIAFDDLRINSGFRASGGRTALVHSARPSLPLFVSVVKQVGPRDSARRRQHALAFSTFTTDQRRLDFDVKLERVDATGRTRIDTLFVQEEHTTRWSGASYAFRVSEDLSLGLSLFWSVSRLAHTEERVNFALNAEDDSGTRGDPSVQLDSRRLTSKVSNAVGRFGVLYSVPKWRFGLMVQPPGVHLRGRAKVRDREVVADAVEEPARGTFFESIDNDVTARDPIPWEFRLGTSYAATADFVVAFDASLYGRTGRASDPVRAIGARDPNPETGRVPRVGDLSLESWYRPMTANASLGSEYIIYDAIVFRGGLYTDFSAAPSLPAVSSRYLPSDIHRFGLTLSVGFVTRGYDISLGAIGRIGFGEAMAFSADDPNARYVRTSARESTLYVFLTGVRSTVNRLARVTVQKLDERLEQMERKERAEDPPLEAPTPTLIPSGEPGEDKKP